MLGLRINRNYEFQISEIQVEKKGDDINLESILNFSREVNAKYCDPLSKILTHYSIGEKNQHVSIEDLRTKIESSK